jgi:formiminoglutamase
MNHLNILTQTAINKLTRKRSLENKIGEHVQTLNGNGKLIEQLRISTSKFVLLGLPEDIGVRANYGRGGAYSAWNPTLTALLNMQSNAFFKGEELLVLGSINFDDLMLEAEQLDFHDSEDVAIARSLVSQIDTRVFEILKVILDACKIPIIIGGGHNNCYPCIKASAAAFSKNTNQSVGINCLNLDAHADFRPMEGRHSGNGFRYAFEEGLLKKYYIIGLHENYNSENVWQSLKSYPDKIGFSTFEDLALRETRTFKEEVKHAIEFVNDTFCGLEIDMDTVQNTPSSAKTSSGVSANHARQYLHWCATNLNIAYLHIAEAAPVLSHLKADNKTGKLLAYMISDFIKAINEKSKKHD